MRGSGSSCSMSTASKRQYTSFSTYEEVHVSVSDYSSASLDDSEAEENARMLQGCEIEYSCPQ